VARNPGDGWGAAAVRGPRETVEKETVETTNLHYLQRDGKY
jgi:hypothetical protein